MQSRSGTKAGASQAGTRFVELVRVSSRGQAERDTPEVQRLALNKLRTSRPGIFVERIDPNNGISGALPMEKRPDLQRLIELTKKRVYDELRVYAVDRLTRSEDPSERMAIFVMVRDAGAVIVDTTGRVIDPRDESGIGEVDYFLQTFFASKERKRIIRRTVDGKRRGAAIGRPSHGAVPYGLKFDRDTGKWSFDEEKVAIVRQVFQWTAGGRSIRQIANTLNENGTVSYSGKRWRSSMVANMLQRETYLGEYSLTIEGESFKFNVPVVVSRELWKRAHDALAHRRSRPPMKGLTIQSLVRGIGECGECRRSMYATARKRRGKRVVYYMCASQMHRTGPRCQNRTHPLELADEAVWSALVGKLQDPKLLSSAAAPDEADLTTLHEEIAACEKGLEKLKRSEERLVDLLTQELLSPDVAKSKLAMLKKDRSGLERRLENARESLTLQKSSRATKEALAKRVSLLASKLQNADFNTRRELIEAVVPQQPGYGVTLFVDQRIEVRGILDFDGPLASAANLDLSTRSRAPASLPH